MKIGYARVSTDDQHLDLQLDALQTAGCEKIFEDKYTGANIERSGLSSAIEFARRGDVLVVWRLDRLSRSLKDLITLVNQLEENGIGLQSLHESIDTTSSAGKLIFHIFGALAEFERNLIRERTMAGLKAARARGKLGGRKKKLSEAQIQAIKKLYDAREHTVEQIAGMFGVGRGTIYNYLKRKND